MIHALALSTRGISSLIVLLIRFMAPGFLLAPLLLWELYLSLSSCSLCFEEHWKAFMHLCCNTACGHTSAAHARRLVLQASTSSRWKRSHWCCCEGTFQTPPKELRSWLSHQCLLWDFDTGMQLLTMQLNALTVNAWRNVHESPAWSLHTLAHVKDQRKVAARASSSVCYRFHPSANSIISDEWNQGGFHP